MTRYDIIRVPVASDNDVETTNRCDEVQRYLYGQSTLLDASTSETIARKRYVATYWLVESHYTQAIIDRLASGLFHARHATPDERYELGL